MIPTKEIYFITSAFVMYLLTFLLGRYTKLKDLTGKMLLVFVPALFAFFLYLQVKDLFKENFAVDYNQQQKEETPSNVCWQNDSCM